MKSKLIFLVTDDGHFNFLLQDPRPRFLCQIGGKNAICMMDTGSPVSAINDRIAVKKGYEILPTNARFYSANKQPLTVIGKVKAIVQVQNHLVMEKFYVIKDLQAPFLTGTSFTSNFTSVRIENKNQRIDLKQIREAKVIKIHKI